MTAYLKAIVAALVAGLAVLITGLDDDNLKTVEWLQAASAFLIAFGAVWATPNKSAS